MRGLGGHHQALLAPGEQAVHDPDVGDDAPVGVVDRVEDQRPGRRVAIAVRGRDLLDDRVQQVGDSLAGLGRDLEHVRDRAADDVGDLGGVLLRLRRRQVDLVQHRDQVQVGLDGQVQVGERLRLDPLRGVDQQDRALAGGQRPGHLVGEVDVAGRVDQVQHVLVTVRRRPGQPDGLALDRDAALALDVHPVQVLRAHLPVGDHAGVLQHPVRERGLAVIDVRDDAEVPDHRLIGPGRLGHWWHRHSARFPGRKVGFAIAVYGRMPGPVPRPAGPPSGAIGAGRRCWTRAGAGPRAGPYPALPGQRRAPRLSRCRWLG